MNPKVHVLNGEDIGNPETLAMLQAFYSRSPMSIQERLHTLTSDDTALNGAASKEEKIKGALKRYYLDYGHASIADCGDAVVFLEGISMLAAKVFQDDPLYNGQECSTRYLDFSSQEFLTPAWHPSHVELVEEWRELYLAYLPKAKQYALNAYPAERVVSPKLLKELSPEKIHDAHLKTCNAIAFDIVRSLLPCGATTNVAWKGSLRRLRERCKELAYHPLVEVRNLAETVNRELWVRHPNSFKPGECNPHNTIGSLSNFYNVDNRVGFEGPWLISEWSPYEGLVGYEADKFLSYPDGYVPLRSYQDHYRYYHIKGKIDFGCARDLLRHRPGLNRVPVVGIEGSEASFASWYGNHLRTIDLDLFRKTHNLFTRVSSLDMEPEYRQYLMPLGTNVEVDLIWNLGQIHYVIPLRTKTSVHPILREWVQQLAFLVDAERFGIDVDYRSHYEASDRGEQTIKER